MFKRIEPNIKTIGRNDKANVSSPASRISPTKNFKITEVNFNKEQLMDQQENQTKNIVKKSTT